MRELEGKVVLVTGSGRGVGRGHAIALARHGARVIVNDLGSDLSGAGRDGAPADEVVAVIKDRGGEAIASYHDISTWDGAQLAVNAGIDHFGRLDGLVNNAGIARPAALTELTEADFDALARVHLKGTFACTAHAFRYWRDRTQAGERVRASVVQTTSDSAFFGLPNDSAYAAMKAGIAQLALCASREGTEFGVRVNAIAPRAYTRMARVPVPGVDMKEADAYEDEAPFNPSNSSPLVAWLLSEESNHVTGQLFRTLGGGVALVHPWRAEALIFPKGGNHFDLDEITRVLNAGVFGSRFPDHEVDFAPGDPRIGMLAR
jgi:NAD(P)-dependent dehydrogenase (short-subunit alcohol dehydrogenase family)